ncbi:hypothetical protein [Pseudochelatococcus contaminans]|uniref:Uncharacterized protein n=1 Tax=Pseudochelatococcus contaminans TaxID=1538103 RepID=A0A7W5Z5H7_9HYPH|nr:hypothetical protein [Pseudochelatococcus contaminans]MBB3810069.1 hypothetical protein [Pseudochelatococcus contaminans]
MRRDLPPLPAYAETVKVRKPTLGEDPLVIAARERAGRGAANRRIKALVAWYDCVRTQYAGGQCHAGK